jgi:hypothetical protein
MRQDKNTGKKVGLWIQEGQNDEKKYRKKDTKKFYAT